MKKLQLTTENYGLSIFPNYLCGLVLTAKLKPILKLSYPRMFTEYYDNANRWANNISASNKNATVLLKRIISNQKFVNSIQKNFYWTEKSLYDISTQIKNISKSDISNDLLVKTFSKFVKIYTDLIIYVWLPVGAEGFNQQFSNLLKTIIKKRINNKNKVNEYFIILSTPTQKTRRALADERIMRFRRKGGNKKEFVKKFLCDFNWIAFDYEGPALTEKDVLKKLKWNIEIIDYKKLRKKQSKIILELKLNKQKRLFRIIRDFVLLKNRQQEAFFYSHYCLGKFFEEIAKRFGLTLKIIRSMLSEEIISLLNGIRINEKKIKQRAKHCIIVFNKGKTQIITGETKISKFIKDNLAKNGYSATSIKGQPACAGYAKGRVNIIQSVLDIPKMKKGDILISSKTSPNLLPAMYKAGAIVTDYGGLTCHAVLVSRELKIPCVIGTKIATKVLKDGDLVEVDAVRGIVRVIR